MNSMSYFVWKGGYKTQIHNVNYVSPIKVAEDDTPSHWPFLNHCLWTTLQASVVSFGTHKVGEDFRLICNKIMVDSLTNHWTVTRTGWGYSVNQRIFPFSIYPFALYFRIIESPFTCYTSCSCLVSCGDTCRIWIWSRGFIRYIAIH